MQYSIFQNFKKYALSGLHRILSGQYNTTVHILGEGERAAPVFQKNLRKRKTASFSRIPGNICVLGQVLGDMWLMTPSRAKLGLIERGVSSGVSRGELWGISLIGSQSQLTLLIVSQKGWPDTFSVTFIASLTLVLINLLQQSWFLTELCLVLGFPLVCFLPLSSNFLFLCHKFVSLPVIRPTTLQPWF